MIAAAPSEALHVLDGLLSHRSGLQIREHCTDTGGATDHSLGLCLFLGSRFAPRLRDIKDRRIYLLPGMNWDELLSLTVSIRAGTTSASPMLRRLAAYPRQNSLAVALRDVGRLERTVFTLVWILSRDMRRCAQVELNKGKARNALGGCGYHHVDPPRSQRSIHEAWGDRAARTQEACVLLSWEHISLTGDYIRPGDAVPERSDLRPLRRPQSLLAT
ncbi:Tn3 family transposase [Lichenicola cladoniae]|uniref:Tn3 family transposase n=1 Tax=Lichenicola cladoniae TaxID=1484109 RepID=A0A6M8HJ79_9PROT|nr:Tn3 family transposase [Acetobacteraceae bacterium]QKE88748.1 Tn3 family transposase [Lichenicola cladoniae]